MATTQCKVFALVLVAVVTVVVAVLISTVNVNISSLEIHLTSDNGNLPLDMAPNSVDDMYSGCREQMLDAVMTTYLENEKNKNPEFKEAWAEAEREYKPRKPRSVGRNQALAIYVYTADRVYTDFNKAVRTKRPQYKTTFKYHALHFLLTDAIQSLNAHKKCLTVYRLVNDTFSQNAVNTEVRFGSFTSTSMGQYISEGDFGNMSCFEVYTCMGADISMHSKYEDEREVLIPPYEVFKVTEVLHSSAKQPLPCDVIYKLKSTGQAVSNLNCALFKK